MTPDDVRRRWAGRDGEYSPAYYAARGADATSSRLRRLLRRHVGRDARVLELGCSAGRHLAVLHEDGFSRLHGVDVNGSAFDVMRESFPDLAAAGTFHEATLETFVSGLDDDAFDAVFSVETLQHVHPESAWVFDDLARVTDDLLVAVENEGETGVDGETNAPGMNLVDDGLPLYYRDWNAVFADRGFTELEVEAGTRDTTRVFSVES